MIISQETIISSKDIDIIKQYYSANKFNIDHDTLNIAISTKDINTINYIISIGGYITGSTLSYAIKTRNEQIINLALKLGAISDDSSYLYGIYTFSPKILEILITNKIFPTKISEIKEAIRICNEDILEITLKYSSENLIKNSKIDLVNAAIRTDNISILKIVIKYVDLSSSEINNLTSYYTNSIINKELSLYLSKNFKLCDTKGVMFAIVNENIEQLKIALEQLGDTYQYFFKSNAIKFAIRTKNIKILETIFSFGVKCTREDFIFAILNCTDLNIIELCANNCYMKYDVLKMIKLEKKDLEKTIFDNDLEKFKIIIQYINEIDDSIIKTAIALNREEMVKIMLSEALRKAENNGKD
jgi:hypothetical protein